MVALLLLPRVFVSGQSSENGASGALDSDVTVVGKDETAIPVPPPPQRHDVVVPEPDMTPPDPLALPDIPPPLGDFSVPGDDLPVVDESGEPLP
jgi:hypothetical protein